MNKLPVRKQVRLKGFVYSEQGYYFVTICTQDMKCILGNIIDNKMILNDVGKIIENVLKTLPNRFPVKLDTCQIMPNHIHFIIAIVPPAVPVGAHHDAPVLHHDAPANKRSMLSQIVGYLKMNSTKQINQLRAIRESPLQTTSRHKIFQRNYYDHIIRNEEEYYKIIEYIELNPEMWERDRNNPVGVQFIEPAITGVINVAPTIK